MAGRRRTSLQIDAATTATAAAVRLGSQVVSARRARRMTQRDLGSKVGVHRSRISQIERGHGSGASLRTWQMIAQSLGLPLRVELGRDATQVADAGHLGIQELLLRLARQADRARFVELPTRPADPLRSSDVVARDDRQRVIYVQEAWNTIGDIGSSLRSTSRKRAEAEGQAVVAAGAGPPYRVAACWVVRATEANRTLVARYPEVFATAFPGSSSAWVRALNGEGPAPAEPGLVWCDRAATRLFAWRPSTASSPMRRPGAADPAARPNAELVSAHSPRGPWSAGADMPNDK